jgi:hypothetical protein
MSGSEPTAGARGLVLDWGTMPMAWAAASAEATWTAMPMALGAGIGPWVSSWARLWPTSSSITT